VPISVLFPLMTLEYFKGTQFEAGIIEAVWSVGALIGGAIMGAKVYKVNRVALLNWMYLIIGLTFLLSGVLTTDGLFWFGVLTAIGGVAGSVFSSAFTGLIQTKIDPNALGRVFSILMTLSMIPAMLGLIGIGFVADSIGLNVTFIISGAVVMIVAVISFLSPDAMLLDKQKNPEL